MDIKENLNRIKASLPSGVRLVAVSKTHPVEMLQEAYDAGQRIFGENKVLTPVCTEVFKIFKHLIYLISISTDSLILFLRKTALREKKVRTAGMGQMSRIRMLRESTAEAAAPILRNFTFALLMTCLGILAILGVLLIAILHITT